VDMLKVARRRAARFGVMNVELFKMDVAHLDFPDAAFDVALASSVFQFVDYSTDVLREWCRVLRPGGRLLLSVPEVSDPAMSMIGDLIGEHAADLPADILMPLKVAQKNPFRRPGLRELCLESGFRDAWVGELQLTASVASVDDWWDMHWSHGIRTFLRQFDDATLAQIKRDATARLQDLRSDGGAIPLSLTMAVGHAIK
jgi:SAM-dependent methyltransferase